MRSSKAVALIVFVVLWTMSTHGKPSSAGDEPYYLIVAHSLWADGDLDLTNNFAQNDGRLVGADGLDAGPHVERSLDGEMRSVHDVGLSVLVLPAYAVGHLVEGHVSAGLMARFRLTQGRVAYFAVSLFLAMLTAAGAGLLHAALTTRTSVRVATALVLLVALSPPVLPLGFLVFPAAPAFFVTCLVLWVAWRAESSFAWLFAAALVLGVTPWLHRKFSFFVLGLALCLWRELRHRLTFDHARIATVGAAFLLPQIAFHVFTWHVWGRWGGPQVQLSGGVPFSVAAIPAGAIGMLLDRSRGLLPYSPIFVLVPVIWILSGRRFLIWLVPVCALFLPLAAYVSWDAGYSPAARFMVPLMPLLVLPATAVSFRPTLRVVAAPLLVVQLFIVGYAWNRPRALWPGEVGDNRVLNAVPIVGPYLNGLFPVIKQGGWQ